VAVDERPPECPACPPCAKGSKTRMGTSGNVVGVIAPALMLLGTPSGFSAPKTVRTVLGALIATTLVLDKTVWRAKRSRGGSTSTAATPSPSSGRRGPIRLP